MGIQIRVDALVRAAQTEERKNAIGEAAKRLVDRTGMGREYQVLGIISDKYKLAGDSESVWPFMDLQDEPKNP